MGSDPETAVAILGNAVHGIAGKSLFDCVGRERTVAAPAQPRRRTSLPRGSHADLVNRQDRCHAESIRFPEDRTWPELNRFNPPPSAQSTGLPGGLMDRPHEIVGQAPFVESVVNLHRHRLRPPPCVPSEVAWRSSTAQNDVVRQTSGVGRWDVPSFKRVKPPYEPIQRLPSLVERTSGRWCS